MTKTGSVLWPEPSSTDCLHLQHSAPGSGSPLGLRQGSSNFSQPSFSTLCLHFTAKRSQNVKAMPRQQPCLQHKTEGFTHWDKVWGRQWFTQRPIAFPNHTQLPWKQKQKMAEQLCPCCLWGTDSGQLPLHMAIISPRVGSGQSWPGDTPARQQGRGCTHCLPPAAQTQPARNRGLAAQRNKHTHNCSGAQTQKCFTSQANRHCMFSM